jgi:UDP-glucose 4-epimerase
VNSVDSSLQGFAGRRILVTGGSGFIGSHLVQRAVELGSEVVSLGSVRRSSGQVEGARYIFGDIARTTLETVDFSPQTIFHLAGGASVADSVANPPADFLKTVYSSVQLLDHVRRYWPEAEIVYVSSAAIYGEAEHKKASHDLTCLPISPYGVHKKQVESLLIDHARMYKTRATIVRAFSVYGPGLQKQLLWDAMEKTRRGEFTFFGSGSELRDWVYASDMVTCLLKASQHSDVTVPVMNGGTGKAVPVRDVLAELFRIAKLDRAPVFLGRPKEGDPDRLVAEDTAAELLGPIFETPLAEGLRAYVDWYQSLHRGAE